MTERTIPGKPDWSALLTEGRNPHSAELDLLATEQVIALLLDQDRRAIEGTLAHAPAIARAAEWVAEALGAAGSVVLAGAGTSGRLGILEAAECPPTFGTDPERIRGAIAGGRDAVFAAREGAEDDEAEGRAAAAGLGASDLCIGISASAVTAYTRCALAAARAGGARTVLLTCAAPSPALDHLADLVIALDTGPEVLTGSTRLKAGSATKAVLNAITTAAMVRLGKVYSNLMVDLRAGSSKLHDRARRIVAAAAGVALDDAARLLERADGEVKVAIVMAVRGIDAIHAKQRLERAGARLRRALDE